MKIQGKRALVTGASSGIGAATARTLAARGAAVLLTARNLDRLDAVAQEIRSAGGYAESFPANLSDPDDVVRLARLVEQQHGAPDILVNNAGAGQWLSIVETSADTLKTLMAVPFFAAFNLTRELLPGMRRRGTGHIVNVSSLGSFLAWPDAAGYVSARWAMRGFTEALRAELAGTSVHVSLAAFSQVSSGYWEHNPGSWERLPAAARWLPTLTPEQAAVAIAFAIERNKRLMLRPRIMHLVRATHALFPGLTERFMRRQTTKAGTTDHKT